MWKNIPQKGANVEKSATLMCCKSSTFAAKNKAMKQPHETPLEDLVCQHVKQLLAEHNISVRKLANDINKDHSHLNKILNREANLPACLIDDFANYFAVNRLELMTEKGINYRADDRKNTIHISIRIPAFNQYKQITSFLKSILKH